MLPILHTRTLRPRPPSQDHTHHSSTTAMPLLATTSRNAQSGAAGPRRGDVVWVVGGEFVLRRTGTVMLEQAWGQSEGVRGGRQVSGQQTRQSPEGERHRPTCANAAQRWPAAMGLRTQALGSCGGSWTEARCHLVGHLHRGPFPGQTGPQEKVLGPQLVGAVKVRANRPQKKITLLCPAVTV